LHPFLRTILPVFGLMGARLAGAGFGLFSQVLLVRAFSSHDVGIAFLAISTTTLASLLLTCGYQPLMLTQLARYLSFGRQRLTTALRWAARTDVLLAGVLLTIAATIVWVVVPMPDDVADALLLGCLAALPLAAIRINTSAATVARRFALGYVPELVLRPMALLLVVGAMIVFNIDRQLDYLLVALVVLTLAIAVGQGAALGSDSGFSSPGTRPSRDLRRFYRSRAGALLIVAVVTQCMADIVVLVSSVFFAPSQVAIIGVAVRLAALVGFFGSASQSFVIRDLTSAMAEGTPGEVRALLLRTNIVAIATTIVAVVATAIFGDLLLSIFGPEYVAGHWLLLVFMLGQAFRILGGMNGYLLSIEGYQFRSAAVSLLAVLVFAILALVLSQTHGLMGLALAALGAEVFWAIGLAVLADRLLGQRGDIFAVLPA
jgi:O-antigen/teichoic acid export membrane protein